MRALLIFTAVGRSSIASIFKRDAVHLPQVQYELCLVVVCSRLKMGRKRRGVAEPVTLSTHTGAASSRATTCAQSAATKWYVRTEGGRAGFELLVPPFVSGSGTKRRLISIGPGAWLLPLRRWLRRRRVPTCGRTRRTATAASRRRASAPSRPRSSAARVCSRS